MIADAVGGIKASAVQVEGETTAQEDTAGLTPATGMSNVVVHVGYDVALAPGADASGIAVDLVALDVTVASARLAAELQDAGMNVAGVKVLAMDKDTKTEDGAA